MNELVNKLKLKLGETLPGREAQYRMAPLNRQRIEEEILKTGRYIQSAVMILFCEDENDEIFFPLTERMTYEGVHSGQISLPGGKAEPSDESLESTALRECFEEIGISNVEVLGRLTHLYIPVSNFMVQPVVGLSKVKNPVMINQEREVKDILKFKLSGLMDDNIVKHGTVKVMGELRLKTPYFDVQDKIVWGATAMILNELKEVIKTIF